MRVAFFLCLLIPQGCDMLILNNILFVNTDNRERKAELTMREDGKTVDIIGVQMDLGASKRGVNMGPLAIRYANICSKMTDMGINWRDRGDILPPAQGSSEERMKHCDQILETNRRLFTMVSESLRSDGFPVVLGGDHSVAAGSIPAVAQYYGKLGLIWIDAHGDFHDEHSTPSGNMHGMPFSAVCGYGPCCMADYGDGSIFISAKRAVQIGGRDLEPEERERMKRAGVTVFSMNEIDKQGMAAVMEQAIRIAGTGTEGIHVSFDIDAVTPQEAPGVGTPVHSGLTVREAFLAAEMLAESRKVVSMDMVEVNPILDERNKTGELACELILSVLGKSIF